MDQRKTWTPVVRSCVPIAAELRATVGPVDTHSHDFIEIALIVRGTADHLTVGGRRSIGAGDLLVLRPGAWHGYDRCLDLSVFNCYVRAELFQGRLKWLREDSRLRAITTAGPAWKQSGGLIGAHLTASDAERCRRDMLRIAEADDAPETTRLGLFLVLLGNLSQVLGTPQPSPSSPWLDRAIDVLDNDYARQWTIGDLARELNISKGYLHRLFHSYAGIAPMAYLQLTRAEKAAALLLETTLAVAEIGSAVGWPDPSYFTRRFRSVFGMSPRQYRRAFGLATEKGEHPLRQRGERRFP